MCTAIGRHHHSLIEEGGLEISCQLMYMCVSVYIQALAKSKCSVQLVRSLHNANAKSIGSAFVLSQGTGGDGFLLRGGRLPRIVQ